MTCLTVGRDFRLNGKALLWMSEKTNHEKSTNFVKN